jgi:hypothetical protein
MKRFFVSILTFISIYVFSGAAESKQYGSTLPGETYFVKWTSSAGVSVVTQENNEAEMWFPSKIKVHYVTADESTTTVDHVTVIPFYVIAPDTVTTNDSGTVTTNHFHGAVTNTTYSYLTNRLCTITNTASASMKINIVDLSNEYVRKGDKIIWGIGNTNSCWFGITGKR